MRVMEGKTKMLSSVSSLCSDERGMHTSLHQDWKRWAQSTGASSWEQRTGRDNWFQELIREVSQGRSCQWKKCEAEKILDVSGWWGMEGRGSQGEPGGGGRVHRGLTVNLWRERAELHWYCVWDWAYLLCLNSALVMHVSLGSEMQILHDKGKVVRATELFTFC